MLPPLQDMDGQDDQDLSQSFLTPIQEIGINDYSCAESQLTTDGFSPGSFEGIAEVQQDEPVGEEDGNALASYVYGGDDDREGG